MEEKENYRVGTCAYCGWRTRTRKSRDRGETPVSWHHKPAAAHRSGPLGEKFYAPQYCPGSGKPIAEAETEEDRTKREEDQRARATLRAWQKQGSDYNKVASGFSQAGQWAHELGLTDIAEHAALGAEMIDKVMREKGFR